MLGASLECSAPSLWIGCADGTVGVLNQERNKLLFDQQLHKDEVRTLLDLSPWSRSLGTHYMTASYDKTCALWGLVQQQRKDDPLRCIPIAERIQSCHTDKVLSAAAMKSEAAFVTTGADGRVVLCTLK